MTPDKVLDFWFKEVGEERWFVKDDALDTRIKDEFESAVLEARDKGFPKWRETARGRLAEIILLDQFTRNIYRGSADAFSGDERALALAKEAVAVGADEGLAGNEKHFIYMPFMHSESLEDQEQPCALFKKLGERAVHYADEHRKIIERFGRFPHRNEALGRDSTEAEKAFLKEHSGF